MEIGYHGTRASNIDSILEKGFILGASSGWGKTYGHGIYLSPDPQEARCYSDTDMVIECEVYRGNIYKGGPKDSFRKIKWERYADSYESENGKEWVIKDTIRVFPKRIIQVPKAI